MLEVFYSNDDSRCVQIKINKEQFMPGHPSPRHLFCIRAGRLPEGPHVGFQFVNMDDPPLQQITSCCLLYLLFKS